MMIAKKCLIFPSYLICRWARLVSMTGQEQDDSSFELIKLSKPERGSPVFLGNLHIRDYFPAAATVAAVAAAVAAVALAAATAAVVGAGCPSDGLKDRTSQVCEYICMYAMYRGAAGLTSKIVLRACQNIFKLQSLSCDLSAQSFLHGFDPVRRMDESIYQNFNNFTLHKKVG